MFVLTIGKSLLLLLIGAVLLGAGEFILGPTKKEVFAMLTLESKRGVYSALDSILFRIGSGVSPLFLVLYGKFGSLVVSCSVVPLFLFGVLFLITSSHRELPNSNEKGAHCE